MTTRRTALLEEIASISGGGTPSRSEPSYFGGNVAWATPTDITALDGLYLSTTKERITDEGLRNSSTNLLPPGAVLLTSRATIGFTAVSQVPVTTNQGFVNFVCGPEILPEYLAYWLRTQRAKMLQHAGGTTFKEIARGTLRKFAISFPPIPTQRLTIDLISQAESIVRLRREARRKAADLIPALFVDMFGDPGENPNRYPLRPVSSFVSRFEGGKNLQAGDAGGSPFRILKVSAVTSGTYRESESKPTPNNYAPPANHLVKVGDLLFSRANTVELVGATAMVEATNGSTLLPDKLWRFLWDEEIEPRYVHALFQSTHVRRELGRLATGTSASMKNISQAKLFALELPIAPLPLQRRFSARAQQIQSISAQQSAASASAFETYAALEARLFS